MAIAVSNNDVIPVNLDAERAILGAIFLRGETPFINETEGLFHEHFSLDAHRRIYKAMLELANEAIPVDMITLAEYLHTHGELEAVGGLVYLSSLIDAVPERASIASYVKIVREKALLRGLINLCQKAIAEAVEDSETAPAVIARTERAIYELSDSMTLAETQGVRKKCQFLVPWSEFRHHGTSAPDWLVQGAIEVGTNGILVGLPKSAKSFAAASLAVSLITGFDWMELKTKRRRVAIVSREDYPGTTARRINQLLKGLGENPAADYLDDYLYLNSRAESHNFLLTDAKAVRGLIQDLRSKKTDFLILDVLKILHDVDENDNTQMSAVLKHVDRIRDEVGCQVCIVHHSRKNWEDGMTLTEIARGAGAIGGFAEFLIGLRLVDETLSVRQVKFETKADEPPPAFYWKIARLPDNCVQLQRTAWEPPKRGSGKSVKEVVDYKTSAAGQ